MKHSGLLTLLLCCMLFQKGVAQTIFNTSTIKGVWQVVDASGKPLHYVEIYEENDRFFGKIVELFQVETPEDLKCTACHNELKNQPVLGLPILTNMERGRTKYSKGHIMDYQKGNYSPCTIWMESENVIKVRSWWLFLYQTRVWYRIS